MRGVVLLLSLCALCCSTAGDMVGCGGFVRSKYLNDFSKVKVNLYTKSGNVKYKTECAPNNGYFLIPLYDKGEYVLKVDPPDGWTFTPSEVEVVVDAQTDRCSQGEDINFDHVGFSIFGQVVSVGAETGPRGVTVSLKQAGDLVLETLTSDLGKFVLTGLPPGAYQVMASHPKWTISQAVLSVEVKDDSITAPAGLTVLGYDVTGSVSSRGEPVSAVQILLYSQHGRKVDCPSSSSSSSTPLTAGPHSGRPQCGAESSSDGGFSFPSLPPGHYFLVPYYRHEEIVFEVQPTQLDITVLNDSLIIVPPFEVQGFSVSGKVLLSENGVGVADAKVFVNGHFASTTDASGTYRLTNITSGSYQLLVEAAHLEFHPFSVSVSPTAPYLPTLTPSRFEVCGQVSLTVTPSPSHSGVGRSVQVFAGRETSPTATATTDSSGRFCAMLQPGQYVVKAVITEEERTWGLTLLPERHDVTLSHSPISSLSFTQFTATITGTISCITQCPEDLSVSLSHTKHRYQQLVASIFSKGNVGHFSFNSILLGTVDVSVSHHLWCWEVETIAVAVTSSDAPDLHFVQTGFAMDCIASHDTIILATIGNSSRAELNIDKGSSRVCLPRPGVYSIKPLSCYLFEMEEYSFDTSSPAPLVLSAVGHMVSASVISPTGRTVAVTLTIRSVQLGAGDQVLEAHEVTEVTKEEGKLHMLHFAIPARYTDILEIIPQSTDLLFIPSQRTFAVSNLCPERVPPFEGSVGVVVSGRVGPRPLVGVAVVLEVEGSTLETTTDESGEYRLGPIHSGRQYTVSARLDGYAFRPLPNDLHSFTSLKLGHIKISVQDSQLQSPLSSVLVSLSGSGGFRKNSFTGDNGELHYLDLVPGEYFLKPLLREYEFSPSSSSLELQQGALEEIMFSGERVAFGCSGKVASLNGHPLEAVVVKMRGQEGSACASYTDEIITAANGIFSFRGLQPDCRYTVAVETEGLTDLNHTIPARHNILLGRNDSEGVNFVGIFSRKNIYISGNVLTDPKHFSTLQVNVFSEGGEESLVYTNVDSIGFFELPPLPIRKEDYHVVLDTNLPSHFYRFKRPELPVAGNEDHHITVHFNVESIKFNEDHSQGSLVALIIALIVVFAAVNFSKIYAFALEYFHAMNRT